MVNALPGGNIQQQAAADNKGYVVNRIARGASAGHMLRRAVAVVKLSERLIAENGGFERRAISDGVSINWALRVIEPRLPPPRPIPRFGFLLSDIAALPLSKYPRFRRRDNLSKIHA